MQDRSAGQRCRTGVQDWSVGQRQHDDAETDTAGMNMVLLCEAEAKERDMIKCSKGGLADHEGPSA